VPKDTIQKVKNGRKEWEKMLASDKSVKRLAEATGREYVRVLALQEVGLVPGRCGHENRYCSGLRIF
jgi:hypothetical protein